MSALDKDREIKEAAGKDMSSEEHLLVQATVPRCPECMGEVCEAGGESWFCHQCDSHVDPEWFADVADFVRNFTSVITGFAIGHLAPENRRLRAVVDAARAVVESPEALGGLTDALAALDGHE